MSASHHYIEELVWKSFAMRLQSHWSGRYFYTIADSVFSLERFFSVYRQWLSGNQVPVVLHVVAFVSQDRWNEVWLRPQGVDDAEWRVFESQRPVAVPGFHRLTFNDEHVVLTLVYESREAILPKMTLGWDALFWETGDDGLFLRSLLQQSQEKALVIADVFSNEEKAILKRAAFRVEETEGCPVAHLMAPRKKRGYRDFRDRTVLVIGAGLAGANAAYALAKAGWSVRVVDEAPVPGARASALAWGILHPHFARDDNSLSRLSREGFLATRSLLKTLESQTGEVLFDESGCLQMAHSDAIFAEWADAHAKGIPFALPSEYGEFVSLGDADRLTGVSLKRGGWWFKQGGMVRAGAFCRALVAASGASYRGNTEVVRLQKDGDDWLAFDAHGQVVGGARHVVVACATESGTVLGMQHLSLDPLRGRITLLRDTDLVGLKAPVSGEGYISHLDDGFCGVGATYENDRLGAWEEEKAHLANLDKLGSILRDEPEVVVTGAYQGVRAVGLGRLPYVGPVCDESAWIELVRRDARHFNMEHPPMVEGLWIMAGMGSRGVSMSTLCARILVSWMDGTPMPIDARAVRCLLSSRSVKKFVETL